MSQKSLILYSSGSPLIVEFEELCLKNNISIEAVIRNLKDGPSYTTAANRNKEISTSEIDPETLAPFLCPLFSPHNRFKVVQEAIAYGLKPYGLLSDVNNDLPTNLKYGDACFINKRVVIGAESQLGNYILINRGACLGHDLIFDDFVSIGPGVISGGNITIHRGAMVGTGAVILPKITIGKHAIVGAGAVVTKDVSDYSVVVGNPAREIKKNTNQF